MNPPSALATLRAGRHFGAATRSRTVGRFTLTLTHYAPGFASPWHLHEAAAFCLVIRGNYVERFRREHLDCREATVVFRPPRLEHTDTVGSAGASCFIVEPGPDWCAATGVSRIISQDRARLNRGAAEWYMRRAMSEFGSSDAMSPIVLDGLMLCVMAMACRITPASGPSPRWLRIVRERLESTFSERVTLSELARDVGVHPVYLAAAFRRTFGVSVGEYVRQRRVERARQLLAEGMRTITDIALELGFANPSHFSRVFSTHTGATPREYRKLHRRR